MENKIKKLYIPEQIIDPQEVEMAKEFYEKIKSGEITHGIVAYRDKEGRINYQAYNSAHFTYLIGLLERIKMAMMEDYMEGIEEEG